MCLYTGAADNYHQHEKGSTQTRLIMQKGLKMGRPSESLNNQSVVSLVVAATSALMHHLFLLYTGRHDGKGLPDSFGVALAFILLVAAGLAFMSGQLLALVINTSLFLAIAATRILSVSVVAAIVLIGMPVSVITALGYPDTANYTKLYSMIMIFVFCIKNGMRKRA